MPTQSGRLDSGITPADAGKTIAVVKNASSREDHPRGCGENAANTYIEDMNLGSPPRMRGKLIKSAVLVGFRQDHPRGCGENVRKDETGKEKIGSPPRMRGKPGRSACPLSELRITPADAGKTGCGFR